MTRPVTRLLLRLSWAFVAAGALAVLFWQSPTINLDHCASEFRARRHFANLVDLNEASCVGSHLRRGSIVIFGSSELVNTAEVPFNWLTEKGVRTVAVGHAHNQSLAILAQIVSYAPNLDGARVAIIFSPGWLDSPTKPQAFAEFVPAHLARKISSYSRLGILPKKTVSYLGTRTEQILPELFNPPKVYGDLVTVPRMGSMIGADWSQLAYNLVADSPALIPLPDQTNVRIQNDIKWETLYASAVSQHLLASRTNVYGVTDKYFARYLSGATLPKQLNPPPAIQDNVELQDFEALMTFLKASNARVAIVLLPFNQRVYANEETYNQHMDSAAAIAAKEGFPVLDLWAEEFTIGMLSDAMHVGPYGWLRVNKFLLEVYTQHD